MPAANERFHASGGAVSSDTEQVTSSVALFRALPIPPPPRKAATTLCVSVGQRVGLFRRTFTRLDSFY